MANSVDDIFSPERLRHRWQHREDAVAGGEEPGKEPDGSPDVMAVFARLQGRIQERFPGEQGESLLVLMSELEEKLLKKFPQTEDREVSEENNSALNQEIETLLNDIEDLAEALEL